MQKRHPRQRSWSTKTIPSSSRLYIAPDGQEATQGAFKQCSHNRGRYIINACSKLFLISPSIFCMLGSCWIYSVDPAKSSSQLGPVVNSIPSPVICDLGRATGWCFCSGPNNVL